MSPLGLNHAEQKQANTEVICAQKIPALPTNVNETKPSTTANS